MRTIISTCTIVALLCLSNLGHSQDIISDGSNKWIFHTPDDGRTMLYIAPWTNNTWDWNKQTIFFNNGDISISGSLLTKKYAGIATSNPRAFLDVADYSLNTLKSVLARLPEGDDSGDGTFLGVKSYNSQLADGETWQGGIKSFSLEHKFYGQTNSSINFYRGGDQLGGFLTFNTTDNTERMRISSNGNVLIGKPSQANSTYKLDVAGKVRADEITVNTSGADFVFENGYNLRPLTEVEAYVKENKHLPDVAPAAEMQDNGVSIGEMNTKLLQKVEELTLYLIEKDKEIKEMKIEIKHLKQNKRR
ncbi:hypothetical protein [uncultured Acetobacteroides sp.]|uniref:hypothetical protein n=1 Tax=uncultured Acetobacteroides sp. TaxID=1760811 RepID=UPI0029F54787|nr:hypothetical protein [uncultured Acetobacteroides sp.]